MKNSERWMVVGVLVGTLGAFGANQLHARSSADIWSGTSSRMSGTHVALSSLDNPHNDPDAAICADCHSTLQRSTKTVERRYAAFLAARSLEITALDGS
jgi:hypothetical protein